MMPAPNPASTPANNGGVGPGQQQQQQPPPPGMMPNGGNMMGGPQNMGYGYGMYGMDPAAAMYGGYPNMMGMVSLGICTHTHKTTQIVLLALKLNRSSFPAHSFEVDSASCFFITLFPFLCSYQTGHGHASSGPFRASRSFGHAASGGGQQQFRRHFQRQRGSGQHGPASRWAAGGVQPRHGKHGLHGLCWTSRTGAGRRDRIRRAVSFFQRTHFTKSLSSITLTHAFLPFFWLL